MASESETKLEKINQGTMVVFVLAMIFCSMEIVPGWGMFNLDWPPTVFYSIMAVAGALVGATVKRLKLVGVVCGIIAGVGSLIACQLVLERVNQIPSKAIALIGLGGTLPGVGLYFLIEALIGKSEKKGAQEFLDHIKPHMPEALYESCVGLVAEGETSVALETVVDAIGERIPAEKVPYRELLTLAKANKLPGEYVTRIEESIEKYPGNDE